VDRTPDAERQALEDLLMSDGWRVYKEHVAIAWGPAACEQALRDAKQNSDPAEWPFESVRILDSFAGMRAELTWPEKRHEALKAAKPAATVNPMQARWGRR
jgi:hypothetical protein